MISFIMPGLVGVARKESEPGNTNEAVRRFIILIAFSQKVFVSRTWWRADRCHCPWKRADLKVFVLRWSQRRAQREATAKVELRSLAKQLTS